MPASHHGVAGFDSLLRLLTPAFWEGAVMTQVIGSLPSMWDAWIESPPPNFSPGHGKETSEWEFLTIREINVKNNKIFRG